MSYVWLSPIFTPAPLAWGLKSAPVGDVVSEQKKRGLQEALGFSAVALCCGVTPGVSGDHTRCNNDIAQQFQQVAACRYTSYTCYTALGKGEHDPGPHAIYFMIVVTDHGRNRRG